MGGNIAPQTGPIPPFMGMPLSGFQRQLPEPQPKPPQMTQQIQQIQQIQQVPIFPSSVSQSLPLHSVYPKPPIMTPTVIPSSVSPTLPIMTPTIIPQPQQLPKCVFQRAQFENPQFTQATFRLPVFRKSTFETFNNSNCKKIKILMNKYKYKLNLYHQVKTLYMNYLFNSDSKLELLKKLSIRSSQQKNIQQDNNINDIDIFMNYYILYPENVKYLMSLLIINKQLILLSQKLIVLIGKNKKDDTLLYQNTMFNEDKIKIINELNKYDNMTKTYEHFKDDNSTDSNLLILIIMIVVLYVLYMINKLNFK